MSGAATEGTSPNRGVALLDRLVAEGTISSNKYDSVVLHAQRTECTIGEAIIQLGLVPEADLLKYVAGLYRTRFVGTERLAKAGIAASLLKRIPRRMASRLLAFPILYDAKSRALSVVAADVANDDVRREVSFATGVGNVQVYVAREASIRAMIAKHYDGDKGAFERLAALAAPMDRVSDPDAMYVNGGVVFEENSGGLVQTPGKVMPSLADENGSASPVPAARRSAHASALPNQASPARMRSVHPVLSMRPMKAPPSAAGPSAIEPQSYREMLKVMVTLLEQNVSTRRGHSAHVARLCEQLADGMQLAPTQRHALQVAAYIHDVGSSAHVTPLRLAIDPGRRDEAKRSYTAPARIFESAGLPPETTQALTHRYERFDGAGFPEGHNGNDIPFGARLLAVAESFAELTRSDDNPAGKKLSVEDACQMLGQHKNSTFDPTAIDWLRRVVLGDEAKNKPATKQHRVLLVDPDPEETAVLDVRFAEQGFDVVVARDMRRGLSLLQSTAFDIVVCEVDLPDGDGFQVLQHVREKSDAATPLIFHTARNDQQSANRGLDLGASDYVMKPASAGFVVAKAQRIVEEARGPAGGARGIAGSLTEMGLPDVIQILSNGRKSGKLKVRSGTQIGELVFQEGKIHDAVYDKLRGADAVYAIMTLTTGDFALDPNTAPVEDVIGMSTEGLLLEAMRRLDEAQR